MTNNGNENRSPAPPIDAGLMAGPDVKIADGTSIDDMKTSIRVIEGMLHACNGVGVPIKWHTDFMNGMIFLKSVHDSLMAKLGPEEIEKIRAQEQFKGGNPPPAQGVS